MKNIYTVEQINKYIKNMFTQDYLLTSFQVKGEISNCKYHSAGHIYFTLKDGASLIKCVMFASARSGLGFKLYDGAQVIVSGGIDVYIPQGQYQLYAKQIVLDGEGALYEKYEALKRELEEEGMFAKEYKQPLPKNPKVVGIVTSQTGAAVRDIIDVSTRRNPYIQLVVYPAIVQGAEAAPSIVKGIKALESYGVDVMIVGRGGGSIEDLWAFNERIVAQAIFDCSVPIVSAVGHEIDFTIADFVSDMRAPTPSAAAEITVPLIDEILESVKKREDTLKDRFELFIYKKREAIKHCERQLALLSPKNRINNTKQAVAVRAEALDKAVMRLIDKKKNSLAVLTSKLDGASPLKKLESGFAYVATDSGKRIVSTNDVHIDDNIVLSLKDGFINATVNSIQNN